MTRALGLTLTIALAACAAPPRPPVAVPVEPPAVTVDQKVADLFRLEQQRVLTDPAATVDLIALSRDADPGIRRRAMLAIGRVGLGDGVPALVAGLGDVDDAVRAMAAFGLGLLGDARAIAPLEQALKDPSFVVQGRAAEGLGLLGRAAAASAPAVAAAAAGCAARIADVAPDDERRQAPDVELCRLAMLALVRLGSYEALASVVLASDGRPVSAWWPVAFALQRSGDRRAAGALAALVDVPGTLSAAFAMRGLASLGDARVVPPARAAAVRAEADIRLRVAAVRALGQAGGAAAVSPLLALVASPTTPEPVRLEAVAALGQLRDARAFDALADLLTTPSPVLRLAAMSAAAAIDPEGFILVLSSLERDRDWTVRAGLAPVLGRLPRDLAEAALVALAEDADVRVQGPALRALAAIDASGVDRRVFAALEGSDFALRTTAASIVGERRPPEGVAHLVTAYERAKGDASPAARLAIVDALAAIGGPAARATLTQALADRDWPVRLRAADRLRAAGDASAQPLRPAPLRKEPAYFEAEGFLRPRFSPHAYVETRAGTIQLELDVVDAPVTSLSFMELARAGFFDGLRVHRLIPNFVIQTGDPRGDGMGGPGFWIMDELSPQPYVRGAVGMALSGPDTGGSQFFIALSPQPHLDARYTVFGRVVAGFELLDLVLPGDVIERVRIWDGTNR